MNKVEFGFNKDTKYERQVNKVRAVLLNKQGRCLVVKCAGIYMLPGGTIDEGEKTREALKREILEEAGIQINPDDAEDLIEIEAYDNNFYDRKENRIINAKVNTKIYVAYTDQEVDDSKKSLTEGEIKKGHIAQFTNLSVIDYLVQTNQVQNNKKEYFDREILTALREFRRFKERENKIEESIR